MLSSLLVRPLKTEFSRYERDISVVTAILTPTGAVGGEQVTVTLERLEVGCTGLAFGPVSTKVLTLSDDTPRQITFDLQVDCIDAISNTFTAIQGYYVIRAVSGNISGESAEFPISVVSVDGMKDEYLTGVSLAMPYITKALMQPSLVTGVTILGQNDDHKRGVFTLAWDSTNRTLSWDSGPPVAVADGTLYLLNETQSDYVTVMVDVASLPLGDQIDSIIMDMPNMSDDQIRRHVWAAYDWVQSEMGTYLEPRVVDTDPTSDVYTDFQLQPAVFFRSSNMSWLTVRVPVQPLLYIHSLSAYIGPNNKVFNFDPKQWLVWNEQSSYIKFVPAATASIQMLISSGGLVMPFASYIHVPNYWHYRLVVGLRDLVAGSKRAVVREAVSRKAASSILKEIGRSTTGPYSSVNVSKDGMSETRSYANSQYGPYGASIQQHEEWLKTNMIKLKQRIIGPVMTML